MEITTLIEEKICSHCTEAFGANCLSVWISGSFAYGGALADKSDIDVIILLRDTNSQYLIEQIKRFVDGYLGVHKLCGFCPDLNYPGEYLTPQALEDAIAGRGFSIINDGAVSLPPTYPGYWEENPQNSYRAWLSMTAFSRFLWGDSNRFITYKLRAWQTILTFTLSQSPGISKNIDQIFSELQPFGLKKSYKNFASSERGWARIALFDLVEMERLNHSTFGFSITADKADAWLYVAEKRIVDFHKQIHDLPLSVGVVKDISEYAKLAWEKL